MTTIYTIGHSNLARSAFEAHLVAREVALVVDVRSRPRSRWSHFNQGALRDSLTALGVRYDWLPALGGLPAAAELHLPSGDVDVEALRASADYVRALDMVAELARSVRTVIMCSEGDPLQCHRTLWLEPDLALRGLVVEHILRDGRFDPERLEPR